MITQHILMVASENDSLSGAKVGGIGDVLRDIPPALADLGCDVTTLVPSYGYLHTEQGATRLASVRFRHGQAQHNAELYEVPGKAPRVGVRHLVLHHEVLRSLDPRTGHPRIYANDPSDRPFATDATRFAAFCSMVCAWLASGDAPEFDCLHLHDWHTGHIPVLIQHDEAFRDLRGIRTVFSIHNLSLQGVRPFDDYTTTAAPSAFYVWFPWLRGSAVDKAVVDPRWPTCCNPMAAGIRLADAVHAVSPTYAEEILRPSMPALGFFGGEGLERDLQRARQQGRLHGILNGLHYDVPTSAVPAKAPGVKSKAKAAAPAAPTPLTGLWPTLIEAARRWEESTDDPVHTVTRQRLEALQARGEPRFLLTSVSRVVAQKMGLLFTTPRREVRPAIELILEAIDAQRGVYVMLGNGLAEFEQQLAELMNRSANFVFMKGYSNASAAALYRHGHLFLMPSSFEPCGISQLMAMREGQPCLVHAVGGLRDTVEHGVTGFAFSGETPEEQASNMLRALQRALDLHSGDASAYQAMRQAARQRRFPWEDSARQYLAQLYATGDRHGISV